MVHSQPRRRVQGQCSGRAGWCCRSWSITFPTPLRVRETQSPLRTLVSVVSSHPSAHNPVVTTEIISLLLLHSPRHGGRREVSIPRWLEAQVLKLGQMEGASRLCSSLAVWVRAGAHSQTRPAATAWLWWPAGLLDSVECPKMTCAKCVCTSWGYV